MRSRDWVLCPPGKVAVSGGMEGRGLKWRGFGQEWPATDRWVVKNLHPDDVGNHESIILDVYATCVGTPG